MRSWIAGLAVLLALAGPAEAQLFDKSKFFSSGLDSETLQGAAPWGSPIPDNRVYIHGFFNQLEGRFGDGQYLRWDGQAWIGNDYNKLWLKSKGRYNPGNRGRMEDGDHELLYDRPINEYFDVQAGVRVDLDSARTRTWAALGIQGLAVGFWNMEATIYASDNGHYALRTNASYDLYLTQRLVLQPQFETNWYTKMTAPAAMVPGCRTSTWDCGFGTISRANSRPTWASPTNAISAARRACGARRGARSTTSASWWACGPGSERGAQAIGREKETNGRHEHAPHGIDLPDGDA